MIFYHRHFNSKYSAKAIYGIILIQVLLVSFDRGADPLMLAFKTFIGALVIVSAEIYSEFLGGIIKKKGHLSKIEMDEIKREALSISAVSLNPTILFLISNFNIISIKTAFNLSYFLGLIELVIFGFIASKSINNNLFKNFRAGFFTGLVGLSIIVVKSFIH